VSQVEFADFWSFTILVVKSVSKNIKKKCCQLDKGQELAYQYAKGRWKGPVPCAGCAEGADAQDRGQRRPGARRA